MMIKQVDTSGSGHNGGKVKEITWQDPKDQRQLVEDRLSAGVIGGDIEHVNGAILWGSHINGQGDAAADREDGKRPPKSTSGAIRAFAEK